MEARFSLYQDMKSVIGKHLPEVQYVGLWNQDTSFLEECIPWQRPAVFVEFGPIQWSTVFKEWPVTMRGTGDVKLHVVTDWNDDRDYEQALSLSQKVAGMLMSISDINHGYGVLKPGETHTNHNHENLLENIEVLSIKWQQVYDGILDD